MQLTVSTREHVGEIREFEANYRKAKVVRIVEE